MGLTDSGFQRRTYAEIVEEKEQIARELFGEDINTDEKTALGKLLRINAYSESLISEENEGIYYSWFPSTSSGVNLDRLCGYVGVTRNPATASRYQVTVEGTSGTEIPIDFCVGTESGINFHNVNTAIIDENGQAVLLVDCTETGEIGNVQADEITLITNPVSGVESIVSVELVSKGDEIESDYALRQRFESARDGTGASNENAIIAAVLSVPTVESVSVVVDESAHSFCTYVSGGADYKQEIAEAIFAKKPIGIATTGDYSYTVTDVPGGTHTIKFSQTSNLSDNVRLSFSVNSDYAGATATEQIKENIANYIDGLGNGVTLYNTALYGLIHGVNGVLKVDTILFSTGENNRIFTINEVTPDSYQKCVCRNFDVTVNYQ